jgi:antitoxin component of RelBE/YafQ-DinJ toxin-antitoxin module
MMEKTVSFRCDAGLSEMADDILKPLGLTKSDILKATLEALVEVGGKPEDFLHCLGFEKKLVWTRNRK